MSIFYLVLIFFCIFFLFLIGFNLFLKFDYKNKKNSGVKCSYNNFLRRKYEI